MTIQMNIAEAKAKLSELVAAAERGEEVVIARGGVAIVRLSPVAAKPAPLRKLGILRELGWMGEPTPYEAFAPDPALADLLDRPLLPGDPSKS